MYLLGSHRRLAKLQRALAFRQLRIIARHEKRTKKVAVCTGPAPKKTQSVLLAAILGTMPVEMAVPTGCVEAAAC